ncbi:hypothetical protein [Macrococcus equipercicus]|uniref:hypothetical protein n=1 Tax=Macrococcus equipercicus TaxID=69967 RepID=UPI0011ED4120|nr:hypothetical protein [Macrococcus equipercicus]
MRNSKIRGMRRKIKNFKREIVKDFNKVSDFPKYIYVPQITSVMNTTIEDSIKYRLLDELLKSSEIFNCYKKTYIIDNFNFMNTHLVISSSQYCPGDYLLEKVSSKKPIYIKQIETKYNSRCDLYCSFSILSKEELNIFDEENYNIVEITSVA